MLKLPNGKFTETWGEALEHLLEVHFPRDSGEIDFANEVRGTGHTREDLQIANSLVTEDKVRWAIGEFSPYKSPGEDGLIPVLLQRGVDAIVPKLTEIYKASIRLSYIPVVWRTTRVTFIPKIGKESYDEAKAFRSISLTSFALKVLEKVMLSYLVKGPLKASQIHRNQHAYLTGKSTETALHKLVGRIEKAIDGKKYALGMFFDIEGAFDNTRVSSLVRALRGKKVPNICVKWIEGLLRSRKVVTRLGDSSREKEVNKGVPQGGCLSPILWCVLVDELLRLLSRQGYYVQGYSDDGVILLVGRYLGTLCDLMQSGCREIERWCTSNGVSVNPGKTELVLFTNKRKREDLRVPTLYGKQLVLKERVKYLGVTLDHKLNWRYQIDNIYRRVVISFCLCRRVMSKSWGFTPRMAHWVYIALIRPVVTYASLVWWRGAVKVTTGKPLNRIQRLACLSITGAMRTTPTAGMESILCLPPLDLVIQKEAMAALMRLKSSGEWGSGRFSMSGHTGIEEILNSHLPILSGDIDWTTPSLHFGKRFTTIIPKRQDWVEGREPRHRPGALNCYTDGSRVGSEGGAGAGVYVEMTNTERYYPLGRYATVFQTEVLAIMECLRLPEVYNSNCKEILIYSDSQAAIRALSSYKVRSSLVEEGRQALDNVAKRKKLSLIWVPGHTGIPGNERADALAREGSATPFNGPEPGVSISKTSGRTMLTEWVANRHSQRWEHQSKCRQTKQVIKRPKKDAGAWMITRTRKEVKLLTGLLTGHCTLSRHLALIGVEEEPLCRQCYSGEEETAMHFLGKCDRYARIRFSCLGSDRMEPKEIEKSSWADLLRFIKESGRFEQAGLEGT